MFPSFIGIDTLCDDNAIWWCWYWNRNTTNIHTFVQLQFWRIWQFLTNIFLINASEILSFLEYGVEGKSRSFWCMKISINITNQITDIKDFGLWKPDAMEMICYKALRRICSRDILCYLNSISKIYKLTLYKQISLVYNNVNTGFPKMAFCEKIVKRTFILIHLVQKKSIELF